LYTFSLLQYILKPWRNNRPVSVFATKVYSMKDKHSKCTKMKELTVSTQVTPAIPPPMTMKL